MRMDCMSSLSFDADPFLSIQGSSFFAIIFGFLFILYGVFWPKKSFFIIGEEEDFLDSLFLFENEALLIVDVELQVIVLLTFIFILLDHVVLMKCCDQLGRVK